MSTSNQKSTYNQIQKDPNVSFCSFNPNSYETISINGKVVFVDDVSKKRRVFEENPNIKAIYGDETNKVFEIFYIDVKEIKTFSITEGAKTIKL